jgi:hypothetical protein
MKKSFILSLAVLGFGCGGDLDQPPGTTINTGVWNSAATNLVVEDEGGGFAPQAPPGSTCTINAQKFTLAVASRGLSWTRCDSSGGSMVPYKQVSGMRVITDAEFKDLGSVLGNLRVVKADGACIADASLLTVTVTNPLGSQKYIDDGFQCTIMDKPLLDRGAIQQVIDRLNKLAVPSV